MTVLFTSVCILTGALIRSISWYLGIVLLHDGIRRRGYQRRTATFGQARSLEELRRLSRERDEWRKAMRRRLTAVGESFSEILQPSGTVGKKERKHPGKTNPFVNAIGIACVLIGAALLVTAATASGRDVLIGRFPYAMLELWVAIAAAVMGLVAARVAANVLNQHNARLWGFCAILSSGVLGALVGGLAMRFLVCPLSWSSSQARELSDTVK